MDVEPTEVRFAEIRGYVEQAFAPQAEEKGLRLPGRRRHGAAADAWSPTPQRLQQILRNLLSNAVKFTDNGAVTLRIAPGAGERGLRRAGAGRRPAGDRVHGDRHRHRHLRRQAVAHLRGVPAGRRHDQPPVRRHRPGPVDQPGPGPRCSAARSRCRRRPGRARRSRCTCRTCWPPDAVRRRCAPPSPQRAGLPSSLLDAADGAARRPRPEATGRPGQLRRRHRADRRRRRAQRLRADQRAGDARHDRALRRQRRGRRPAAGRAPGGRHRADGRHDARPGRVRDDPADPAQPRASRTCRSSS